jgi:hypothetical protein
VSVVTSEEHMDFLYGWTWHEDERHPIDEMTEDEARKAFTRGPQVAVIALPEPGGVPAYVLEMSADAEDVRVIQYTPEGSVAANLDYTVPDGEDRLFLEEVGEWLYPDDGKFHSMGSATAFREYFFSPDGTVEVRSRLSGADAETVEEFTDVDVSDHWVDRVTWGDWDRIGLHRPKGPEQGS